MTKNKVLGKGCEWRDFRIFSANQTTIIFDSSQLIKKTSTVLMINWQPESDLDSVERYMSMILDGYEGWYNICDNNYYKYHDEQPMVWLGIC